MKAIISKTMLIWVVILALVSQAMTSLDIQASDIKGNLAIQENILFQGTGQVQIGSSEPCNALDMVVLIDQSGSMNNVNDRGFFRIAAARDMIERLAVNALLECPRARHRLAIGSFGSDFEWVEFKGPDMPSVNFASLGNYGDVTDMTIWRQKQIDPLQSLINEDDKDETDTITAVVSAAQLLNNLPSLGELPRKKAVVLITDGVPFRQPEGLNTSELMRKLREALDANYPLPDTPEHISFWVVALNATNGGLDYLTIPLDMDNNGVSETSVEQFWKDEALKHGGDFIRLSDNKNEIPYTLNQIYGTVIGLEGIALPCRSPFYVDPYTQTATFTFSKNIPGIGIELQYNDQDANKSIKILSGQVFDNAGNLIESYLQSQGMSGADGKKPMIQYWSDRGSVERYTINRPYGGEWMINSLNCPDIRALYQPVAARARLLSPRSSLPVIREAPYYDKNFPVYFEVQVVNTENQPIPQDTRYPIVVSLSYTDPSGKPVLDSSGSETMILDHQGEGLWRSLEPIRIQTPGDYKLSYQVKAHPADPRNNEYKVFFEETGLYFTVLDVDRFSFEIVTPKDETLLPFNEYQGGVSVNKPISITVQMWQSETGKDGQLIPLKAEGILLTEDALTAQILSPEGNEEFSLRLAPSTGTGQYVGEVSPELVSKIKPEIWYTLLVQMKESAINDKWRAIQMEDKARFMLTKRDSFQMELVEPKDTAVLHTDLLSACSKESLTRPVVIQVRLWDVKGEQQIDPQILLANGKEPGSLITGILLAPRLEDGSQPSEGLKFRAADDPDGRGTILVTEAGTGFREPGTYQIKLEPNPDSLNQNYVAPGVSIDHSFRREDETMTSPATCRTLQGTGLALAAVLVGVVIYLCTGGPGGRIELFEMGKESKVLASIRLSKCRIFSKIESMTLGGLDIGKIQYKKYRSVEGGRSVDVKVMNKNDELILDTILEKDSPTGLTTEIDIVYR